MVLPESGYRPAEIFKCERLARLEPAGSEDPGSSKLKYRS